MSRKRWNPPLPRTCLGCGGRLEVVGLKRAFIAPPPKPSCWVCAKCEPIALQVFAEEGVTLFDGGDLADDGPGAKR